ncbi:MAG TPA: hypothetical protein VN708_25680, partial [Terriglobales bacterium]|nr:hypothetical protein [Terriglobales bacterium]
FLTTRPFSFSLLCPAPPDIIQSRTWLNVPTMRRNGHVSYAKKAFGDDCCYFETIEAFPALPMGYSHECRLNIALRSCAPNLHLYFTGYEQKVPACGTNFTVQVATVEKADQAPASCVGFDLDMEGSCHCGTVLNKNAPDLNL